ncbi:unnamed protein product [Phytophthora lilii]|uniref:Unnamed protein product n=1 Tax=Phytophthora lilii TaxID=2077276 RepID=A0A9W6WR18_9STRA|nr:unnamed protein product [Phytophthora lilii]
MSCRRLVRSPNDTGTLCATCARSQKHRASTQNDDNSDQSSDSPRNSAIPTPGGSGASVLVSLSPLSAAEANARCDGSQVANCLDNGCSRSFGRDCNCVEDCTCNSPTALPTSRMAPLLTSSNAISTVAISSSQAFDSNDIEPLSRRNCLSGSTPKATMIPRVLLQVKPYSSLLGIDAIVGMLLSMSGVRSVHVLSDSLSRGPAPADAMLDGRSNSDISPSSRHVVVRGDRLFDLGMSLTPLRDLHFAHISIIEESTVTWARKEVVLRVPDMMCPGNCGSSVLNAVRIVAGVEAAKLRFEHRQVVVRGDMNVEALRTAVTDIGFDSQVDAVTLLPRRFRFRVDDLSDVGLNGVRLKNALKAVEGVENVVLLTDRVEVLVIAMLLDSAALVEAAKSVGFEMLELSEEAWGIPMEVVQPTSRNVKGSASSMNSNEFSKPHECDMNICPQNGCPRYMTTVAHTAALAVGWAVPGCGMSSGGECTCGDSCKCEGCPEHNPVS